MLGSCCWGFKGCLQEGVSKQPFRILKLSEKTKFRDITPKNASNKEYEIKTHHLRVYLFHDKNIGRVIVCGGKKGTQKADIKHFRNIKKEYFNNKP